MGASSSKIEEDKALQLCRERRKFVRQALDGRCSLAAAHVTYIQSLRSTGIALRKFVEPEVPIESSLSISTSATPEPPALTEKSLSHFSVSSPSLFHPVDAAANISPSPSPPSSSQVQAHHMKFRGFSSKTIEEKPPVVFTGTVTSSSTPQNTTPRSTEKHETSQFDASSVPPGTTQWDYFEPFHPIDHQFSFQDGMQLNHGFGSADYLRQLREEEGILIWKTKERKLQSEGSEDEFDDPPVDTLVRSFENLNRVHDLVAPSASQITPSASGAASETELLNGKKGNSPGLLPLRTLSAAVSVSADRQKTPMKEDQSKNKVSPKDFFASIKDIEYLFIKASESGKEVPRMLEANKLHFRPVVPGKENGSVASTFFKACLSCGEDPSQVQEEPAQNDMNYLTWHRTTSSQSSSSRTPLGLNAKDDSDDPVGNLFDNFCMISGSHASTLDRLYAWERKLYEEVKASEMVRREYDTNCKVLRQLESNGKSLHNVKIDKTRAIVKDLHSRIRVALHRIDSISKRIEELRDKELQPQLEELIDGYSESDVGSDVGMPQASVLTSITKAYKQLQCRVIYSVQSPHRFRTCRLTNLSWLFKCVYIPANLQKRKRRQTEPSKTLRYYGPNLYMSPCGVWFGQTSDPACKGSRRIYKGFSS
ncbi:protein ALTERED PHOSPHATEARVATION RESPONSE 1 [Populus alba x Populus x berolinensis]|uniref:Protein ALTERED PHOSPHATEARVATION RESPONSE 1 n=1 Tax=Populus alba x Populus x berolinensis TaxID=444605 RepID=A0AAD6R4Z5_9ROSI|nr:protein ALTERED PHOSPHATEARVATION RESPONSE 1 [Populus alba x Populus x berolinensis]